MYALEQALAVAVVWLFVRQVLSKVEPAAPDRQRRELAGLVVAFWLAVFAQIGAALLWPGMVAAAVLLHGRALLGSRRALSVALGVCLLAPLVLIAANTVWGATGTAATSAAGVPSAAFVGAQHVSLNFKQVLTPDLGLWARLFEGGSWRE